MSSIHFKAPGFLSFRTDLNTKLIVMVLAFEVFMISGALYATSHFLNSEHERQNRALLLSQITLLETEAHAQKEALETLRFVPTGILAENLFQIADSYGRILWDSSDPKRMNTLVPDAHPLFRIAKPASETAVFSEFVPALSDEHFLGMSASTPDNFVVMGAFSRTVLHRETLASVERLLFWAILFSGLSLIALAFFLMANDFQNESEAPVEENADPAAVPSETQTATRAKTLPSKMASFTPIKEERFEIYSHGNHWGYHESSEWLVLYASEPKTLLDSLNQSPNSLFIATFRFEDQTLYHASYGHAPAWIVRNEAQGSRLEVIYHDPVNPENKITKLNADDILFFYNDALLSEKNRAKDLILAAAANPELMYHHLHEMILNQANPDLISFTIFKPKALILSPASETET